MANFGQAAVGIVVLVLVIAGLLYLFYSRTNAVEKTGYGALIMLAIITMMIPVFWITEGANQVSAQQKQHEAALERGMALYAQNCTNSCFGIDPSTNKVTHPTYNGWTVDYLVGVGNDELRRIISAGVYNPQAPIQPANPNAVPRSSDYGGGLLSNDIDYLQAFIQSSSKKYSSTNEFDALPAYLQANNVTLYNAAVSFQQNGQFGEPTDLTSQKAVTIQIVDPGTNNVTCQSQQGCFTPINVKVKVGTVITWVNKSKLQHTVTALVGQDTANPKPESKIFDSTKQYPSGLLPTNATFSYTVTQDAYNYDPTNHAVLYYCQIHPNMLAKLTIVP
jgi:plastocyanin